MHPGGGGAPMRIVGPVGGGGGGPGPDLSSAWRILPNTSQVECDRVLHRETLNVACLAGSAPHMYCATSSPGRRSPVSPQAFKHPTGHAKAGSPRIPFHNHDFIAIDQVQVQPQSLAEEAEAAPPSDLADASPNLHLPGFDHGKDRESTPDQIPA